MDEEEYIALKVEHDWLEDMYYFFIGEKDE
jgi:hypothetical protein